MFVEFICQARQNLASAWIKINKFYDEKPGREPSQKLYSFKIALKHKQFSVEFGKLFQF